jgi:hypothetical protein
MSLRIFLAAFPLVAGPDSDLIDCRLWLLGTWVAQGNERAGYIRKYPSNYGFISIKPLAVTAAGAQFRPPGYETDLLCLACLATLALGGSGPLAFDSLIAKMRKANH